MLMAIVTSIDSETAFCICFMIKQRRLHKFATAFNPSIIIFLTPTIDKEPIFFAFDDRQ